MDYDASYKASGTDSLSVTGIYKYTACFYYLTLLIQLVSMPLQDQRSYRWQATILVPTWIG